MQSIVLPPIVEKVDMLLFCICRENITLTESASALSLYEFLNLYFHEQEHLPFLGTEFLNSHYGDHSRTREHFITTESKVRFWKVRFVFTRR